MKTLYYTNKLLSRGLQRKYVPVMSMRYEIIAGEKDLIETTLWQYSESGTSIQYKFYQCWLRPNDTYETTDSRRDDEKAMHSLKNERWQMRTGLVQKWQKAETEITAMLGKQGKMEHFCFLSFYWPWKSLQQWTQTSTLVNNASLWNFRKDCEFPQNVILTIWCKCDEWAEAFRSISHKRMS